MVRLVTEGPIIDALPRSPIPTTLIPFTSLGIVTAPPAPVYPVIVAWLFSTE